MTTSATTGYSSPSVCALAGVPPSTLHYWASTGVVKPSLRGSTGKRATRWWSLSDLIAVRAVKALRDAGCPLQTLRKAQSAIADSMEGVVPESVLYWDGVDLLRVGPMGEVSSVVRHPGQGVLHVVAVPIGAWRDEVGPLAETVNLAHLEELTRRRHRLQASPGLPSEPDLDTG